MTKIFLSFDDGFLDQFKWARALFHFKIPGTFYVNPINLDTSGFLKMSHLRQMHDEWGHTIANHLWSHECPMHGISPKAVVADYKATVEWLCANDFADGSCHVALPYGSFGGSWTLEYVNLLLSLTDSVRDAGIRQKEEIKNLNLICAKETVDIDLAEQPVCARYFHQYPNLKDVDFISMLEKLDLLRQNGEVEFVSILEVAHVSAC